MNSAQFETERDAGRSVRPLWEHTDYKELLIQLLQRKFEGERGKFKRLAEILGVHPTMITHIFRDEAHLSPDQAVKISRILGLTERERAFFFYLVLQQRASDPSAQQFFQERVESIRFRLRSGKDSRAESPLWDPRLRANLANPSSMMEALCSLEREDSEPDLRARAAELFRGMREVGFKDSSAEASLVHRNVRMVCLERLDCMESGDLAIALPVRLTPAQSQALKSRVTSLVEQLMREEGESAEGGFHILVLDLRRIPAQASTPSLKASHFS